MGQKYDKNEGYFTSIPMCIYDKNLAEIFVEREMFQAEVAEIIQTHILWSTTSPKIASSIRQCRKNIAQPDRSQMTIYE